MTPQSQSLELSRLDADLVYDARAEVGEGPVWDEAGDRFLWVDNALGSINELRPRSDGGWAAKCLYQLGRPVAAALPRARGGLIIASGIEFLVTGDDARLDVFATLDADPERVLINEAKCDPQGRIWAGTRTRDFSIGGAALYRLDPDGRIQLVFEGVSIGNGMGWSPDGRTMYFVDSPLGRIDAFDFDGERGTLARRRTVVNLGAGGGWPDGLCIDAAGGIWAAFPLTGEVRHYTPTGELRGIVQCAALFAASCAFGGSDRSILLITSATIELPSPVACAVGFSAEVAREASKSPGAGGVFACRPGVTGRATNPFAG